MQTYIAFLFKSVFIAALLYAYYMLFLRGRKMHSFNRFYLISAVAASALLPLFHFQLYAVAHAPKAIPVRLLQAITLPDEHEAIPHGAMPVFTAATVAVVVYIIVAITLLAATLYKIAWIYQLKNKHAITKEGSTDIVHTSNPKAPFSFFNTIFWRDTIDIDSEEGRQILKHEMAHISQRHTIDKLFVQLAVIVCWANPIYWLIRKELSQVHEFIADEAAIQDNDTSTLAAMLLQCHYAHLMPHIVNPFFYSSIKRRIIMLKQKKTKFAHARRLMALPLLAGAAALCSCKITESMTPATRAEQKITMVLDAGHGGNDAGAVGNEVMEKDLNLRICRKIAALAPQYNIGIVPTRPDDNYVVLSRRSEMANNANADLLLSIHVNKASAENPVNDGYEVIVSQKCPQIAQSQLLASAIIGGMVKGGLTPALVNKGIFMLKNSNIPAVTIECGRLDNVAELALLQDDARLESLCRNILSGVVAYENSVKK